MRMGGCHILVSGHNTSLFENLQKGVSAIFFCFYRSLIKKDCQQLNSNLNLDLEKKIIITNSNNRHCQNMGCTLFIHDVSNFL